MCQSVNLFWNIVVQNSSIVVFPPIFAADTKLIYGYNFVVPLSLDSIVVSFNLLKQKKFNNGWLNVSLSTVK